MTQPLALLFYERLLPGSQLVNRLQDLGYRVQTITDASEILSAAKKEKPMFMALDVKSAKGSVPKAIRSIRGTPETRHIPILCFGTRQDATLHKEAAAAGANLVALEDALL